MSRDDPPEQASGRPPREVVFAPHVRLFGEVNRAMLCSLLEQFSKLTGEDNLVALELTTLGGDAEIGRRILLEIDLMRERHRDTRFVFIGKTVVYSAGTTIMSAFAPADRFLVSEARLMVHCRQLEETLALSGPIRSSLPRLRALCRQIETGIELETEHFERLLAGSDVTMDELLEKALCNWYLTAAEALERGLIGGIL